MEICQGCGGAGCKQCKDQQTPKLFIPIEPMGAVRTTQKGKYTSEAYKRYASYKEHIGLMAKNYLKFIPPGVAVAITDLTFYMPIPESGKVSRIDPLTGKRKKYPVAEGMPHITKPDIDNLIKGLFDSLNGVAWADDAQIFKITNQQKVYREYPGIEFGIEFLN
jgi:Holliday junction resolvase RusA-like endonuclease